MASDSMEIQAGAEPVPEPAACEPMSETELVANETTRELYYSGSLFPNPAVLAKLSNEVYGCGKWDNSPDYIVDAKGLTNWSLVAVTSRPFYKRWRILGWWLLDYYGEAYFNKGTRQLVIVHKGTSRPRDYIADFWLWRKKKTGYIDCAYSFSLNVINAFRHKAVSITVTGHSLGGYLAQTTAFFLKKHEKPAFTPRKIEADLFKPENGFHVHVVAFDSPGVKICLQRWLGELNTGMWEAQRDAFISDLDISIYISKPNFINTLDGCHQLGRLFFMPEFKGKVGKFRTETHSMDLIEKYICGGSKITEVPVWLADFWKIQADDCNVEQIDLDSCKYLLSVFTSEEKSFLMSFRKYLEWEISDQKLSTSNLASEFRNAIGILQSTKVKILSDANRIEVQEPGNVEKFISTVKFLSQFEADFKCFQIVKTQVEEFPGSFYQQHSEAYVQKFAKYEINSETSENSRLHDGFCNFMDSSSMNILAVQSEHAELVSSYLISILRHYKEAKFMVENEFNHKLCISTSVDFSKLKAVKIQQMIQESATEIESSLEILVIDCSSETNISQIQAFLYTKVKEGKKLVLILPVDYKTTNIDLEKVKLAQLELNVNNNCLTLNALNLLDFSRVNFGQGVLQKTLEDVEQVNFSSFTELESIYELESVGKLLPKLTPFEEKYNVRRNFDDYDHQTISYTEEQIAAGSSSGLTVLVDEAGMGKSVSMKKLALTIKQMCPKKWVIFVNLGSKKEFEFPRSSEASDKIVLSFLYFVEGIENSAPHQSILEQLVYANRVVLLLDGFDELYSDCEIPKYSGDIHWKQNQILQMIEFIIRNSKFGIEVFVSSRQHAMSIFNSTTFYSAIARKIKFIQLNPEEQIEFLNKYFTNLDSMQIFLEIEDFEIKVRGFCQNMVTSIKNVILGAEQVDQKFERFLGIPQYLYMLAKIHTAQFRNSIDNQLQDSSEQIEELRNILCLYERFVNEKYSILRTKLGWPNAVSAWFDPNKQWNKLHSVKSLDLVPDINADYRSHISLNDVEIELVNRIGLAVIFGPTEFVHQTVADYFVALHMLKLEKKNQIKPGDKMRFSQLRKIGQFWT